MFRFRLIVLLGLLGIVPLIGQTTAPVVASGTNAPSAVPPVASIAIGDVISQAETVLLTLQNEQSNFATDQVMQTATAQLPVLAQRIDKQFAGDKRLLESDPALADLQKSQDAWQAIAKDIATSKQALTNRANKISDLTAQLEQQTKNWQATLTSAKTVPAAITQVQAVLTAIDATIKSAQALQAKILSVQSQVSEQDLRASQGLAAISKAQNDATRQLFEQDHPPLWAQSLTSMAASNAMAENNSFHEQVAGVQDYLADKMPAVGIHLLILILLTIGLYSVRNTLRTLAEKEVALENAEKAFASPFATAFLLSLLVFPLLYPVPHPRLLMAALGALALVPAIIILRRLLEPALFPILYALVAAYLADQLRHTLIPAGAFARLLLVLELLAGSLFIVWLFKSKRLSAHLATARLERWLRPYLHLTLWVFVFAGMANLIGYVQLSVLVSRGMLASSYLALVFFAAVRIIDALVFSVLSIPPFNGFRVVKLHRNLIYGKTSDFINWVALALWLLTPLEVFSLRDPAWKVTSHLLTYEIPWGSLHHSLGDVLAFGLTIWASFLLSRFLRFVLAEEVYPNLSLGRGIPYAASTMLHYTILMVGFFVALMAAKVNLTQFAVLGAGLGVGLGLGLQNIMNNFVSGIILLFERPIKVGDTLQMDAGTGVVQSIGIRASVIRLSNGASVIVPNGNLISNTVTNWSLRNNRRTIEIPLTVSSKVDPQHILDLLIKVAGENKQVLKTPTPQALLTTLSGTGLAFRLRASVDAETDSMQVTSDLSLAINAALAREGIVVS